MHSNSKIEKPSLLFIAAWWPNEDSPTSGIFIREHALSLSQYFEVHVVHLTIQKSSSVLMWDIAYSSTLDNGLHVHIVDIKTRIRSLGIHDILIKKGYSIAIKRIKEKKEINRYCVNVRSHITKLIPELDVLKGLNFMLIEHFSFYHRVYPQMKEADKDRERREITHWFSNARLKRVMPVSYDLEQIFMNEFKVDASRIKQVNNISDPVFEFKDNPKNNHEETRLICVGKWESPKRPDLLITALQNIQVGSTRLVVDFFGEGSLIEDLKDEVTKLDPNISLRIHGIKSKSEISGYMQEADALVHPTDAENAPAVISEALCCGVPVLSMRVNGIPEMIDQQNGILVEPNNSEEFTIGLTQMIAKYAQFNRKEIAMRAQAKYSREKIGAILADEISNLGE